MNYLFIRAYAKDDYIARLCVESWKLQGFEGQIIFFNEPYETKWCSGVGVFHERKCVGNFGGQLGATALIEGLKHFTFKDDDIIVTCDTDVVIKDNPIKHFTADFAGTGGVNESGFIHLSGQLMIYRGAILNKILSDSPEQIKERWQYMDKQGMSIADDSFMSYCVHLIGNVPIQIFKDKWVHEKYYNYEPREDFENIISEIIRK